MTIVVEGKQGGCKAFLPLVSLWSVELEIKALPSDMKLFEKERSSKVDWQLSKKPVSRRSSFHFLVGLRNRRATKESGPGEARNPLRFVKQMTGRYR